MVGAAAMLSVMSESRVPPSDPPTTFREALDSATDFVDFLNKVADVERDGPDLVEVLEAERHGGGWVPERAHPE